MKSSRIIVIVSIVSLFALSAFAAGTAPAKAPAPAKHPMSHGIAVRGTVTSVDQKAKTFELKDTKGAMLGLTWNDATKVTGSQLATGEQATVRYMVRDGQKIATVINAHQAPKAAAAKK